jgi:cAMP-specific phosphodiesterase 4/calcium/calmodulin-dependent 3',5'-cyclic nucleotide phosphodiesterase
MTDSEFASYGLSGFRLRLANILRSKIYDYMQIGIIAVYAALIILYLVFDDGSILDESQLVFLYYLEIALLSFFILDITLYIISFRLLYLRDTWNIIDIVVITLSIAFVLLDIFSSSQSLKAFLKLRAVFRLLRVFLLIRKLNALRRISETGKRRRVVQPFTTNTKGYDMNSPLENVIRILTELVGQIDSSESAIITDLNYCIKAINSNQLYEAEVIFDQGDSPD